MRRRSPLVVLATAAFIAAAGCGRPLEPTPRGADSSSALSAGAATLAPDATDWACVAADPLPAASCRSLPRSVLVLPAAASAPGVPSNLGATISGTRVALTWTASVQGDAATSYVIEAGSAAERADLANFDTGSAVPAFTATNVPAGTYFIRVRAKNAAGVSAPSTEISLVVCGGLPDAPANLAASVAGSTVSLTWSAPAGACTPTSYLIDAGSSAGLSNLASFDTRNTATSYSERGVDGGVYYVRVRAVTPAGPGAASNEIVVIVQAAPLAATSFVAFGDSITWGEDGITAPRVDPSSLLRFHPAVQLPETQRYPYVLQQSLAARYRTQAPTVKNEGLSGEAVTDSETFLRFAGVLNGGYNVVLIMEGTNDLSGERSTRSAAAISGLRDMVRYAKSRRVTPLLATIPPMNSFGFRARTYSWELVPSLNDSIRALALAENVTLADVNLGFNNNYYLLSADGLHPNADGAAKIAEVFFGAIKTSLEAASTSGAVRPAGVFHR